MCHGRYSERIHVHVHSGSLTSRGVPESETGSRKRNSANLFLREIRFFWDCVYALRHCLCSYILNFSSCEEATDEKNVSFFLVWQNYNNWVVREGRICALTKTCPERERSTRLAFQSLSVTSPICTGCWARNPVRCEEVVSLSYDKFSLTVSISGTLKLHYFFVKDTSSSVLLFFLVVFALV